MGLRVSLSYLDHIHSYYKESHKILGNTYGMCVLQDFEAITPNLLARTIETVEGGGLVVLLLKTMTSLKQLYAMTMVRRFLALRFERQRATDSYSRMSMLDIALTLTIPSLHGSTSDSFCLSVLVMTVSSWTMNSMSYPFLAGRILLPSKRSAGRIKPIWI